MIWLTRQPNGDVGCYIGVIEMEDRDMDMESDGCQPGYDMPNVGCMLGMAYQAEVGRLSAALSADGLDITAAEYVIMRLLYARGRLQQCDIARLIGKDKGAVSRCVKALVAKGYVTATAVSYKCCEVSMTDKGMALKPRIFAIAERQHDLLAQRLTPEQMKNLKEILNTLIRKEQL